MHEVDMAKLHREEARWRILKVLDAGRPLPVNEAITLRALQGTDLPMSPHGLRRELDYLEERKLLVITGKDSPMWSAELTRLGVDLVEYTVDCDAGIARPKKWF